jgi:hypothetical protein
LLWSIITTLRREGRPPSHETRVYADPRVLAGIAQLFGAVATVVPRLFGDKLHWVDATAGKPVELETGASLTMFSVDHEPIGAGAMGCVIQKGGPE